MSVIPRYISPTPTYKVLGENGEACNGGRGSWFLPSGKRPGKWMPKVEHIKPCESGYHLCERGQLVDWVGPTIWRCEWRGEVGRYDDKIVVQQARLIEKFTTWNERTQRLFACDCAERVLHLYESKRPEDRRVRDCIKIAHQVANGDLPVSELAAAQSAAWNAGAAAGTAVEAGAWAAARAAGAAAHAATWDAWAAAAAAAWAAAWGAARNAGAAGRAAGAAEREWQTTRLFEYLEDK